MDDKLPISAQTHREDSFDTAVRGFNRQQVLEYMARSSQLLASLEQNLAVARADVQRARSEAARAEAEAEALRTAPVETKPVHEEVSGRLSQILRLAAEEADQDRATANEEITKLRLESQAESERLINEARAEAERELAEARDTAERELAEARDTAERELTEARDTAEDELRNAREEAERIRLASEEQSAELLDDAARRAGAVNEVSDQRLDTLTATHGEAVLRLGQIRDVLADLLDRDAAAGSLADVVEAVIAPPGAQRELDTRPELEDGLEDGAESASIVELEQQPERESEPQPKQAEQWEHEKAAESIVGPDSGHEDEQKEEPDQIVDPARIVDQDETTIVPPVAETAVHEAVRAPVAVEAPVEAPTESVRAIPLSDTVEHQIDLRDATDAEADAADRPVSTPR